IAYAGGVYQARLDSLMVVKQAIDELNAQGFPSKLLILGKNDPAQLTDWGIGGPNVSVRFIKDRSEFMGQLRRSDILLSTIAFKSAYPLQDQTCFPTKTFDYFLAGKPVLAVAPNHTAYGGYMKEHQSAIVVGSLNAEVIAEHIHQLATDMDQRRQLVDAGFAQLDTHHQRNVQPILQNVLRQDFKGIVA
ncbi:MAG: glycosyltransferase, partial [Deltaproteobacteria bacterium]|nr:glycosyltransferase [Deltaproteobacteria bacterium]